MHHISKRRFGNHDTERFDHLPSQHASVGSHDLGQVKIDCRLRCDKSQWGVIGQKPAPAGIIYLDLNFHQPANSRLKHATVIVTLDNANEDSPRHHYQDHRHVPYGEGVQLYEWFGPRHLTGQPRNLTSTKESSILPQLDVGGFAGFGGIGKRSEKVFDQESRWMFFGQLVPGKSALTYKTIQWDLVENDLEAQPLHSNVIHTAFSFHHSERPFIMRIEVRGRLRGRNDRMKHNWKKFSSWLAREGTYAVTRITPNGRDSLTKPLDELARGLRLAMEKENFEEAPIVIPGPREAVFGDGSGEATEEEIEEHHHAPSEVERTIPLNAPRQKCRLKHQANAAIEAPSSLLVESLRQRTLGNIQKDHTLPTVENLRRALAELNSPERSYPNAPTLNDRVGPTAEEPLQDDSVEEQDVDMGSDDLSDPASLKKSSNSQEEMEAVLTLLRISGLLSVIQVLAAVLASCGIKLQTRTTTESKEEADKKGKKLPAGHRK